MRPFRGLKYRVTALTEKVGLDLVHIAANPAESTCRLLCWLYERVMMKWGTEAATSHDVVCGVHPSIHPGRGKEERGREVILMTVANKWVSTRGR